MTEFQKIILWILGGFFALISTYMMGKKNGKDAIKSKTQEEMLKSYKKIQENYNMSHDDLVERMQQFGNK